MTFEYYDGSVFECAEYKGVEMIVNTVNCKGAMGAGLALEFKLRYPEMYCDYKQKCSLGEIKTGKLDIYNDKDIKILNFPTKDDWRKPSDMNFIRQGLLDFYNNYKNYQVKTIAFPKLGTRNGGLDWNEVKELMERCFNSINEDVKIYICLDHSKPKGIENEMLSILNNITKNELKNIGLRSNAIENLLETVPLERFFLVSKIKGLGNKSYEKLHAYCYEKAKENDQDIDPQQLSLF